MSAGSRLAQIVVAASMLEALSGCTPVAIVADLAINTAPGADTYPYGGKSYEYKQEALAAATSDQADLASRARAAPQRIGGTLNFHVPDKPAIMHRGFASAKPLSNDVKDYRAELRVIRNKGIYDAVVKRGSFDSVTLRNSRGEHVVPQAGESVVYYHLSGPEEGGWYFSSRAADGAVRRGRIGYEVTRSESLERWLERLEELAKQ